MIGLLVAASVLSIFFVPLALDVFELVFNVPLEISPLRIARTVSITVLLPLGAGMLLQRFAPALADRFAKPIGITATALLGVGAIALLAKEGPGMWALVGNRTLLAMAVFAAAAIAAGHVLGVRSKVTARRWHSRRPRVIPVCRLRSPRSIFPIRRSSYRPC